MGARTPPHGGAGAVQEHVALQLARDLLSPVGRGEAVPGACIDSSTRTAPR